MWVGISEMWVAPRNVGRNIRNVGRNIRNVGRNIRNVGSNIRNVEMCGILLAAVFLICSGLGADPGFAGTLKFKILYFLFFLFANFSPFNYYLSKVNFYVLTILMNSVAHLHHIDADPDPNFHLNADSDPTFCSRVGPGHC